MMKMQHDYRAAYTAPEFEVVEIAVEQGFALSPNKAADDDYGANDNGDY